MSRAAQIGPQEGTAVARRSAPGHGRRRCGGAAHRV